MNVYALDASTGALKWNYTTGKEPASSPAVSGGVVYVSSWDRNVYALDASTGALKWKYAIIPHVYDIPPSSPAISGGIVYVSSEGVYAFQGTLPPSTSPSVGFVFVVIGIGVGGAAVGVGVAVAMSRGSEVIAYGGYYYCRKHRVPLSYVDGRLWCPIERRHLRTG
jgi:outer membrane protein assembly factor BamB